MYLLILYGCLLAIGIRPKFTSKKRFGVVICEKKRIFTSETSIITKNCPYGKRFHHR